MKLIAQLADVCLPDYWTGHHLAHISVPVDNHTAMVDFKKSARNEIILGTIMGADYEESEEWENAALSAIDNLETKTPGYNGPLFPNLEETEEDYCDSVQDYIVFTEE